MEWVSLILRWTHIVTGAAWIGTSFYFNWLNNQVRPREGAPDAVAGELWAIHGGHFYQVTKYKVAPPQLPKTLHWFKWEAYFTWITGASLIGVVYYADARAFMIDPAIRALREVDAIGIGLIALVAPLVFYEFVCRSPLGRKPAISTVLGLAATTAIAWALCQALAPRAAYMHVGAMLGTIMAWNVWHVIIPSQQKTVRAMIDGKEPDPELNRRAAQRSLHNNYFTLPVLFIMVSNHYPMTYGHSWNWAILAGLSVAGAAVRHWFNLRGLGRRNVWILPAAATAMVALALVTAPRRSDNGAPVSDAQAQAIVTQRCVPCHSASPTFPGWLEAPQGVVLDTLDQVRARRDRIRYVSADAKTMPIGNLTHMTDNERATLAAWLGN